MRNRKAIYATLQPKFLSENPNCWRCACKGTELHHKGGRHGEWLIYWPWFVALCSECHRWATDNKQEAIRDGFSISNNMSFKDFIKQNAP